ncbi:hypothetical protein PsAD2_02990 [Pseudovibrio axinellae]|uniref:Uncharacterized protein n=1 Tax=Pseudovibrio axinellae TaxID=989403 RepID=A0A165XFB9_9HYPH|nr:hypothetical protein [Pseudovibrio axinellae]KZL17654.1 hypothetical protein PsAD2_02990 [Pseudovibrio axinellae]SER44828.1 hypothetical protein SAMN05421798_11092 [Pseudovibrio axinellae]
MPRKSKHSDATLFIVYAMWLKGHTEAITARVAGLKTKKQVAGIIARSPWKDRAGLGDVARQDELTKLRQIHYDADAKQFRCGGRLRNFEWSIEPLCSDQRKRSR